LKILYKWIVMCLDMLVMNLAEMTGIYS
ncbi:hypothetical protein A2U01_0116005, partial [Trifolium medium]|nr:hypothetical protein [Trifolium medium]